MLLFKRPKRSVNQTIHADSYPYLCCYNHSVSAYPRSLQVISNWTIYLIPGFKPFSYCWLWNISDSFYLVLHLMKTWRIQQPKRCDISKDDNSSRVNNSDFSCQKFKQNMTYLFAVFFLLAFSIIFFSFSVFKSFFFFTSSLCQTFRIRVCVCVYLGSSPGNKQTNKHKIEFKKTNFLLLKSWY